MSKSNQDYSVLVIGETCEDRFMHGYIERISPEAPVPIFKTDVKPFIITNPGMAGNVAENTKHSFNMFTMVLSNEEPIVKTRFVDYRSGQMVLRWDEHDICKPVNREPLSRLLNNKWRNPDGQKGSINFDAIIISDYCKGFLEEDMIRYICENNTNVFLDTKKKLGDFAKDADFIKINELEYRKNHDYLDSNGFKDKLIVTLGSKGCKYKDKIYEVEQVPVKDVSGAGDTFIAGLVRGWLDTNNINSAIDLAQKVTTLVVQQPTVVHIPFKELQSKGIL